MNIACWHKRTVSVLSNASSTAPTVYTIVQTYIYSIDADINDDSPLLDPVACNHLSFATRRNDYVSLTAKLLAIRSAGVDYCDCGIAPLQQHGCWGANYVATPNNTRRFATD